MQRITAFEKAANLPQKYSFLPFKLFADYEVAFGCQKTGQY